MKEGGRDSEPRPVEIKFGMMFAHWYKRKCSIHVVVDVGEKDWFETSAIMPADGKLALALPGTGDVKFIDLILGQLTKEQILEGYDNWFEEPTPKKIVEEINKNSLASPRIINY